MSPVVTGNAGPAIHDHPHITLPPARRCDEDPLERLERLRAAKAVRSPIKVPVGGWTGPEPKLPTSKKVKAKATRKAKPADPKKAKAKVPTPDVIERRNELAQQWEQFQQLAAQGATAKQIADTLGLKIDRVRRDAKAAGITLTKAKHPGRPIEWDVDLATRLAAQGLTAREIAEHVGAATVTVRRVLGRHGVTLVDGRAKYSGGQNSLKRRGDVDPERVRALYREHGNATHVARLVGCSPQTVVRILHDLGVHVRTSGEAQRGRPGQDRAAHLKALMREHGTTPVQVRTWGKANGYDVARNGIPSRLVIEAFIAAKGARS